MNPSASSGLKKRCKHRGIKPSLRVRRPRVAEASAEAQALREGGLNDLLLHCFMRKLSLLIQVSRSMGTAIQW